MRTHGFHGLSGLNANEWRRILTQFGQKSVEISKEIAEIAKIGDQRTKSRTNGTI